MKKKYFLTAITVMIMAIVMVFSLVACNENGEDNDPANMKGEEVTAEQWVKAFDFSDATNITSTSVAKEIEDGTEYIRTTVMEYDGDKNHYKSTIEYIDEEGNAQKSVYEYYMFKEDGKVYEYEYDEEDEVWSRNEIIYDGAWNLGSILFAEDYAKFTYNDGKKGYVATYDIEGVSVDVLVKIKNGKLAYAEQKGEVDGELMTVTMTISGINSTTITLPTIAEDSNN